MRVSLVAGFFYFLVVGAAGVCFGVLREMFVSPVTGHGIAVALELPVMLAIAWFSCQRLVTWCGVLDKFLLRLLMGAMAFTLLMVMELSLSFAMQALVFAQPSQAWTIADYLGLAGQVTFGLMPLFVKIKAPEATPQELSESFHKVPFPRRNSLR